MPSIIDKPVDQLTPLRLNIPNLLTGIRVLFTAGVISFLIIFGISGRLVAGVLLMFAWTTDWLDGFLARKLGQQTLSGSFFDLIADRLLMDVTLIISIILGFWQRASGFVPFNPFPYAGLIWATDFTLVAGIIVFIKKRRTRPIVFPTPTQIARITFSVQMTTLTVGILGIGPDWVLAGLMYLTILFTLTAAYSYLHKGFYIFTQ